MSKYSLLIILVFAVASCKSLKKTVTMEKADSFSELLENKINLKKQEFYSCEKVDIKLLGKESINARAKVLVSRDKFIFISVAFMGFEVGRAQITKDSIKYINRLNKEYYFGKRSELEKLIGIDMEYEMMENLLIKGLPLSNRENKNRVLQRIKDIGNEYVYHQSHDKNRFLNIYFDKSSLSEKRIELTDQGREFYLVASLSEYRDVPFYPGSIKATVKRKGKNYDFLISVGKIDYKNLINTSFKVGNNYKNLDV